MEWKGQRASDSCCNTFPTLVKGKDRKKRRRKEGKKIKILKSPPGGTPEMGFQDLFKD
jgi:hypothetical protein